ncbi:MAG: heptosyltransferase II, partial [Candidatus Magnetoglobus multicellularis str. Araruama]
MEQFNMKHFNQRKRKVGLLIDRWFVTPLFFKKNRRQNSYNRSLLIFDFHRIGDIVLLTALLKSIRNKYRSYKITLVAGQWAKALLENNPGIIDEIITFNAPWVTGQYSLYSILSIVKLIKRIKKEQFEFGIEVRGDLRQILLMHFCGINKIVSYLFTGGKFIITHPVPYDNSCKHLIDFHRNIAKYLNCPIEHFFPRIWLSEIEKDKINHYKSKSKKILGIHPGASNILRVLPCSTIVEVIDELLKKNWKIWIFQGPQEEIYVKKIVEKCHAGIHVIHTNLRDYIVHIASCTVVLSMDSACGHIASALNVPSVVVFGPARYQFCKPIGKKVSIVQIDNVPCRPCNQKKCIHHIYHYCMKGISSEQIIKGINDLLI